MSKKTSLADAFKVDATELQPKPELGVVESASVEKSAAEKLLPSGKRERCNFSEKPKKRHIGGYFDEAVYRQLKIVGAEKGLTTQAILTEALNAFFRLHDKPPIA